MKLNFKELRKDWKTNFKSNCPKLLKGQICACFKKTHYAFGEDPIICNMHKCPEFKGKLEEAMNKLGAITKEEAKEKEKVEPKEKEIEVDKI